uniref:Uncharacterized protein n=1 Tax=Oryza glumipatula TaxID=40148 RepID=A0A0E0A4H6_9ORYZ
MAEIDLYRETNPDAAWDQNGSGISCQQKLAAAAAVAVAACWHVASTGAAWLKHGRDICSQICH